MAVVTTISGIVVLCSALFQFWLAGMIVFKREQAEEFLLTYGSSARAHYTEQVFRMIAGVGLVIFAPQMWYSPFLYIFGWVIILSTTGLLLIPWRWHHKFAQWVVPPVIRFIYLYALGAIALGLLLLYALTRVLS